MHTPLPPLTPSTTAASIAAADSGDAEAGWECRGPVPWQLVAPPRLGAGCGAGGPGPSWVCGGSLSTPMWLGMPANTPPRDVCMRQAAPCIDSTRNTHKHARARATHMLPVTCICTHAHAATRQGAPLVGHQAEPAVQADAHPRPAAQRRVPAQGPHPLEAGAVRACATVRARCALVEGQEGPPAFGGPHSGLHAARAAGLPTQLPPMRRVASARRGACTAAAPLVTRTHSTLPPQLRPPSPPSPCAGRPAQVAGVEAYAGGAAAPRPEAAQGGGGARPRVRGLPGPREDELVYVFLCTCACVCCACLLLACVVAGSAHTHALRGPSVGVQ